MVAVHHQLQGKPVRRRIRELLGLSRGQRVPVETTVELWLGISTDEAIRMKDSRDMRIVNRYPLIEAGMSRWRMTSLIWLPKKGMFLKNYGCQPIRR